jgi:anhydro-N-acetylmuramic acid kinase
VTPPVKKSLMVAGVMSGTSADGVDVAIVRISRRGESLQLEPQAHASYPYPARVRTAVLAAMNAESARVADLARLNWRLGEIYADAIERTLKSHPVKLDLVGCHGQTLYHQGRPAAFLGSRLACTWQAGEPAVIAARLHVPIVSDFRPADIAAGGQGAPLVPLLDALLFRDAKRARVLQNLGGIANLTAIPAAADFAAVLAFDTGPANMVIDALMQTLLDRRYDRDGRVAARGRVLEPVLRANMKHPFFCAAPPKSAGREEFGRDFSARFLAECRKARGNAEDAVATATALTADSICDAYRRFVAPRFGKSSVDYILSGGGAKNATLFRMLDERLTPLGCTLTTSDAAGIRVEAKEAIAFALLAYQTMHHLPGNLPSATGASRPAILGRVTYV